MATLGQTESAKVEWSLETACGAAFAVSTDVDLRLRDISLLNRHPDPVI
jgi:hypothetical protein